MLAGFETTTRYLDRDPVLKTVSKLTGSYRFTTVSIFSKLKANLNIPQYKINKLNKLNLYQ
jgi:hypothetical protein